MYIYIYVDEMLRVYMIYTPSGRLLQFAIEHGPVEIVSFPIQNGDLLKMAQSKQ